MTGPSRIDDGAKLTEVRVLDMTEDSPGSVGAAVWPIEDYADHSVPLAGFTLVATSRSVGTITGLMI